MAGSSFNAILKYKHLFSILSYKLEGCLLVYLWLEKVKRESKDPLDELLLLVGASSDKSLDKVYEETANPEAAASGSEQGAAALPTARPEPKVEMYPCIYCAGSYKVTIKRITENFHLLLPALIHFD